MTTYRAALCGLGNIAWRFDRRKTAGTACLSHASAYERHPATSLIAGFSPDRGEGELFRETMGLPAYLSLAEMLETETPDIVSICSPSPFHYEQVRTCLEHAVPMVWLEKPPAITVREVDELLTMVKSARSTVLVNYQRRYLPAYEELRHCFFSRTLGTCRLIQMNYSRGLETNGSHLLDVLFFVTGDLADYRLEWVSTFGSDENPSFALTLGDGTAVIVSGASLPYHNIDISLTCDGGRIAVLYGGMDCRMETVGEHALFPGFYRLYPEDEKGWNAKAGLAGNLENGLKDLLEAHEQQRLPVSSLQSARKTTALIQEVFEWRKRPN